MSSQKAIALQLRKLASDPSSQTFICQEAACMSGLLSLLQSSSASHDVETLLISLQALLFLASHPSNKEPLTRQPSLILRLTALMDFEEAQVQSLVQQILTQLQGVVNRDRGEGAKKGGGGRVEVRRVQRYLHSVHLQLQREGGQEWSAEERGRLEKAVICVKGVLSVSATRGGGLTLYTKRDTTDLLPALRQALLHVDPALSVLTSAAPSTAPLSFCTSSSSSRPSISQSQANKENFTAMATGSCPAVKPSAPVPSSSPFSASIPSSSPAFASPSVSRALVAHSTLDGASLQSRFQAKQRKAVEVEAKQGMVKGLFSSVSSFFW